MLSLPLPPPVSHFEILIRRHLSSPSGCIWDYSALDRHQRKLASTPSARPTLILSETASVITLGRRANVALEIMESEKSLLRSGTTLQQTDRGGLATWHGPGQWVLFPVAHLEWLTGDPRGVRRAVETLLKVAQQTAENLINREQRHQIQTILEGPRAGVWLGPTKLASVGVAVQQGVLLHGLSLNIQRHPLSFRGLRPCGLDGVLPGFLSPAPYGSDEPFFIEAGAELLRVASRLLGPDQSLDSHA